MKIFSGYWKGTYKKVPEEEETSNINSKTEDKQETEETHDARADSQNEAVKSQDEEVLEKLFSADRLEDSEEVDDEMLAADLKHSLELSNETFERIERLCQESSAEVTERAETFENPVRTTVKKQVTWESNVKDNSLAENRLNEEKDFERDRNFNLANHFEVEDTGSGDTVLTNQKVTGASWDVEISGFAPSKKPTKRSEALKNARTQQTGEIYSPPKVLVSTNQIAQRKILDLKRWLVLLVCHS